ncbi:SCO family protein [Sphingobacterium faecium]|uniref:SCO family protein n=1 Tax=Sphingobacterium faecium TaxID=34087 RepID=UPI00320A2E9D
MLLKTNNLLLGCICSALLMCLIGCRQSQGNKELPILGEKEIVTTSKNGVSHRDTIYHHIPQFRFVDQDSNWISNADLKGKIYLADFFFTRCPTICPIMSKNMLEVAKHFQHEPRFTILSHTIDPDHDTPSVLKTYAQKLGAPDLWKFVNGPKATVYDIAGAAGYFSFAVESPDAPGDFDHSGVFTLIDEKGHVRGVYSGIEMDSVKVAIQDIQRLLDKR